MGGVGARVRVCAIICSRINPVAWKMVATYFVKAINGKVSFSDFLAIKGKVKGPVSYIFIS